MEEILKQQEPFWGEWHLEKFIGSGICGDVWKIKKGEDRAALKVTSFSIGESQYDRISYEGMNDENFQYYMDDLYQSSLKEYSFMKELSENSHIVRVYEQGKFSIEPSSKGWMMVYRMDLLEPFDVHLRNTLLTIPEVIKIGIHICRALDVCREHHILHRDIAPGNFFYCLFTDSYLLGDFGMAAKVNDILSVPEKAGTYAPPEVYLKNQYSFQSDLYQLGVILYRMLNDFRIPFLPIYPICYTQKDRSIALFRRYQGEIPPPPRVCSYCDKTDKSTHIQMSGIGATVTRNTVETAERLGQFVMKAIHPDIKERYTDSSEFRKDLESLV